MCTVYCVSLRIALDFDLLVLDIVLRLPFLPRSHDSVLAGHTAIKGALELGAEGKGVQVGGLIFGKDDALLGEGLVLHAGKTMLNVVDLGVGRVGGLDCASDRWGSHAVGAEAGRGARGRVDLCGVKTGVCQWLCWRTSLYGGNV